MDRPIIEVQSIDDNNLFYLCTGEGVCGHRFFDDEVTDEGIRTGKRGNGAGPGCFLT